MSNRSKAKHFSFLLKQMDRGIQSYMDQRDNYEYYGDPQITDEVMDYIIHEYLRKRMIFMQPSIEYKKYNKKKLFFLGIGENSCGFQNLMIQLPVKFDKNKCSQSKLSTAQKKVYQHLLDIHPYQDLKIKDEFSQIHASAFWIQKQQITQKQQQGNLLEFDRLNKFLDKFRKFRKEQRKLMPNFWDTYQMGMKKYCTFIMFFVGNYQPSDNSSSSSNSSEEGDQDEEFQDDYDCNNKAQYMLLSGILKMLMYECREYRYKFLHSFIRFFPDRYDTLIGIEFNKDIEFVTAKRYLRFVIDKLMKVDATNIEIYNAEQFLVDIRYFINENHTYLSFAEIPLDWAWNERLVEKNKTKYDINLAKKEAYDYIYDYMNVDNQFVKDSRSKIKSEKEKEEEIKRQEKQKKELEIMQQKLKQQQKEDEEENKEDIFFSELLLKQTNKKKKQKKSRGKSNLKIMRKNIDKLNKSVSFIQDSQLFFRFENINNLSSCDYNNTTQNFNSFLSNQQKSYLKNNSNISLDQTQPIFNKNNIDIDDILKENWVFQPFIFEEDLEYYNEDRNNSMVLLDFKYAYFEVERILEKKVVIIQKNENNIQYSDMKQKQTNNRVKKIKIVYRVKWKGYSLEQSTWEERKTLQNLYKEYFTKADDKFNSYLIQWQEQRQESIEKVRKYRQDTLNKIKDQFIPLIYFRSPFSIKYMKNKISAYKLNRHFVNEGRKNLSDNALFIYQIFENTLPVDEKGESLCECHCNCINDKDKRLWRAIYISSQQSYMEKWKVREKLKELLRYNSYSLVEIKSKEKNQVMFIILKYREEFQNNKVFVNFEKEEQIKLIFSLGNFGFYHMNGEILQCHSFKFRNQVYKSIKKQTIKAVKSQKEEKQKQLLNLRNQLFEMQQNLQYI